MGTQRSEVILAAMGLIRAGRSAQALEFLTKKFPAAAADEITRALDVARTLLEDAEYLAERQYDGVMSPEGAVFRLREVAPYLSELEARDVISKALFATR